MVTSFKRSALIVFLVSALPRLAQFWNALKERSSMSPLAWGLTSVPNCEPDKSSNSKQPSEVSKLIKFVIRTARFGPPPPPLQDSSNESILVHVPEGRVDLQILV